MAKDYYEILGVPRNAPEKEIRQAFRKQARKHHPDLNPGDKTAEAKFKEINEAHEVLSNPESRRKYNQFGENWKHADQFQRARQGPFTRSTRTGTGVDDSLFDFDLGSIFDRFTGGRPPRARRRSSVEHPVEVTLEEAFSGGARLLEIPALETCKTCNGSGRAQNRFCVVCGGTGSTAKTRRLEVKIPPGVNNGSSIKIPGGSGENIILKVSVRPHKRFERKGKDLNTQVSVDLYDAILGGEAEVTTLNGKVMLKLPPETKNGRTFRLKGQGMPGLKKDEGRGDLYATVEVVLPANLSEEERHVFEELSALRKKGEEVDG